MFGEEKWRHYSCEHVFEKEQDPLWSSQYLFTCKKCHYQDRRMKKIGKIEIPDKNKLRKEFEKKLPKNLLEDFKKLIN